MKMNESGGLYATILIVLGSTAGGMAVSFLQWLDATTRGITGPQATLLLGFVGFAFQYGPRAAKWAAARWRGEK